MTSASIPFAFFVSFFLLFVGSRARTIVPGSGSRIQFAVPVQDHQAGGSGWQNIKSVADVCHAYPVRIRSLVAALNLEQPALAAVKEALQYGDTVAACKAVLRHYRIAGAPHLLQLETLTVVDTAEALAIARLVAEDSVNFNGVAARVPLKDHGGWDWGFTGPQDDQEFGYSLNGLQYLLPLFHTWRLTGNEMHVATFDRLLTDWIIHNPLPAESDSIYIVLKTQGSKLDYRDIGEVRWRTLEAGNRLGVSWPYLFFGFQQSDAFSPATRLLMLASIYEHAEYLSAYHKQGHNWTTMEMNGLALTGLTFPEFKRADEWAAYALDVMKDQIFRQVYPDGVQKELSTKTQWVALRRFESVADYFARVGREVPGSYETRLEAMYNYLAYAMRPDGHQPLNNDSDREDLRPRVLKAAKVFNRPDWTWIATNGKRGSPPDGFPSAVFPWAGIHVMRSGWNTDDHWAFFDTGPFGTGHQHADKLHLSIAAYGRDLLVDGGRYTHEDYFSFDPTVWRGYFRSAFSHNVILVDGRGQNGSPVAAEKPLQEGIDYVNTSGFDYARGSFASGFKGIEGNVEHSRAVLYVRNKFWIVVDEILTDQPRDLQVLWHFAPSCVVRVEDGFPVSGNEGEGNLRIMPVGKEAWELKLIKGQTKPFIQGWYSETYGTKVPNTTAVFSKRIPKSEILVWLLVPAKGQVPKVSAALLEKSKDGVRVLVREPGKKPIEVTVPLQTGRPAIK